MSGPVSDLQTNSPDDFTLVISWRPPTTPNGEIISYIVRIENLTDGTTLRYIMDHILTLVLPLPQLGGCYTFYYYSGNNNLF